MPSASARAIPPVEISGWILSLITGLIAEVGFKMQCKCLEIRDAMTFIPVICIKPIPDNEEQRYLLRRDGYSGGPAERCVIYINAQCRDVAYDPYDWPSNPRTHRVAHAYIEEHWDELKDGDVIDVEFILGEALTKKISERESGF